MSWSEIQAVEALQSLVKQMERISASLDRIERKLPDLPVDPVTLETDEGIGTRGRWTP